MKRYARGIFVLVGVIMPILVGLLHSYCHFTDLTTPAVQDQLNQSIQILGQTKLVYNAWGLVSFMMGLSFIVIGLLSLSIFARLKKEAMPPLSGIAAIMVYLFGVLYSAHIFEAAEQFYGAVFGLLMMGICCAMIVRTNSMSNDRSIKMKTELQNFT